MLIGFASFDQLLYSSSNEKCKGHYFTISQMLLVRNNYLEKYANKLLKLKSKLLQNVSKVYK